MISACLITIKTRKTISIKLLKNNTKTKHIIWSQFCMFLKEPRINVEYYRSFRRLSETPSSCERKSGADSENSHPVSYQSN